MSRFGLIPTEFGGGPKYRIIWAPSRRVVLTGVDKTMVVQMYCAPYAIEPVGESWIIESWKSPTELAGSMTKEEWESNPMMLNTGPYPSRGGFIRRETLSCNPSDASIEKAVSWLEAGGKRRPIENALFCQDAQERSMKERHAKSRDLIRNAMRPFGMEAFSAAGGSRMTKTLGNLKTREELGLPAEGVMRAIRPPKREVFEVMTEI